MLSTYRTALETIYPTLVCFSFALFVLVNIVEEISKPITLAMRLFGNILAGEILLEALNFLAPVGVLKDLDSRIACDRSYPGIFTILVTSYCSHAIGEEH